MRLGRDPDLGRDRASVALGRRAWNVDVNDDHRAATSPWASTAPLTRVELERDRLAGIPPRTQCMWPNHAGRAGGLDATIASVRAWANPARLDLAPATALTDVLQAAAPTLWGQPLVHQHAVLTDTATRAGLDPSMVVRAAEGVGQMTAQRLHLAAPARAGSPALNALAHVELAPLVATYLARERLLAADASSDPDLPRLWMLTNGLHHRVPGVVMGTTPAVSHGLEAAVHPTRDELVGWRGMTIALDALDATVTAAHTGSRWLADHATGTPTDVLAGIGVIGLTAPRTALRLLAQGAWRDGTLPLDTLKAFASPPPADVCALSDAALHGVCARHGWLLGTAEEIVAREVVERAYGSRQRGPLTDRERHTVADHGADALYHLAHQQLRWEADWARHQPARQTPNADAVALRALLDTLGREAVATHAGVHITPRQGWADAVGHRWPGRAVRVGLRLDDPRRYLHPTPRVTVEPAPGQLFATAPAADIDIGW